MSIKDRQIRQAMNRILQKELQKGKYPSIRTIARRIKEYLRDHTPGLPTFRFRPAQSRGTSNPHDYNQMIDEIYDDLHMVFSETNNQTKRLLSNFDYGEVERNNLTRQLQRLEDRIDHLLLLTEDTDGYLDAVYDDFRDYSNIDEAKTTAHVDLNASEVLLQQVRSGGSKYNLGNAHAAVKLLNPSASMETLQPIENALDDYLNTAWVSKVTVSEPQEVAVEVKIVLTDKTNDPNDKFADEILVSCIEFVDHSPRKTTVSATWSNDDINYFPLRKDQMTVDVKESTRWLFDAIPMQYIKLKLVKNEPDENTDDGSYIYRFGAKQINVSQLGFKDEGRLVSKPFKIEKVETINQLALDVDVHVPAYTDIDYYIMLLPQVGAEPILHPISPIDDPNPKYDKVLNLSDLTTPKPIPYTGQGKSVLNYHGIDFYEVAVLPQNPLKGSVKLYRGLDMWERRMVTTEYFTNHDRNHMPTMADWVNLPPDIDETQVKTKFVTAASTGLPFVANSGVGTMFKFTTNIHCQAAEMITGKLVATNCNATVMANSKEADTSGVKYNLRLKAGWNKIDILVYVVGPDTPTLDLGFSPCKFGAKVLAERTPIIETSYYNLQNNVLMKDHSKFAMSGRQIVVNHDTNGIKYEVTYTYSANAEAKDQIMLVAELSRDKSKTSLSPRLKGYRLKIS